MITVDLPLLSIALAFIHLLGIVSALDALYLVRTSRSGIAWGVSLITFPYVALPTYWIFGRSHFRGYHELVRKLSRELKKDVAEYRTAIQPFVNPPSPIARQHKEALERLSEAPFLGGNRVRLLIDGEATFQAIFEAIRAARAYVLIQSYILRADTLGCELRDLLIDRAREGVRIFLLFDEIGSKDLPEDYQLALQSHGIEVRPFATRQGRGNFFQFNFRNHRKIVVVDGEIAFVGGHNVGDEYLSRSHTLTPWRDTHLEMKGPVAAAFQASFFRDWMWATQQHPALPMRRPAEAGDVPVLCTATGPTDDSNRATLFLLELIHCARSRLWIASPYFVPDDSVLDALKLAALRGVDVRILLPGMADSMLSWWAAYTYLAELPPTIKVYRTCKGFMHQKVILVDNDLASVGTMNLDNRSLHLNFEISAVIASVDSVRDVAAMLERDFSEGRLVTGAEFSDLTVLRKILAKWARLFSPIL